MREHFLPVDVAHRDLQPPLELEALQDLPVDELLALLELHCLRHHQLLEPVGQRLLALQTLGQHRSAVQPVRATVQRLVPPRPQYYFVELPRLPSPVGHGYASLLPHGGPR